jgi:hypothetical protein
MPPTTIRLSFDKPAGEYRVDAITPYHSVGDTRWTQVTISDGSMRSVLTFDHDSEDGQWRFIRSMVTQALMALMAMESSVDPKPYESIFHEHACATILTPFPHDNALHQLRPDSTGTAPVGCRPSQTAIERGTYGETGK